MTKIKPIIPDPGSVQEYCRTHYACASGIDYAMQHRTMADVWDNCVKYRWCLWMIDKVHRDASKHGKARLLRHVHGVAIAWCEEAMKHVPEAMRDTCQEVIDLMGVWLCDGTRDISGLKQRRLRISLFHDPVADADYHHRVLRRFALNVFENAIHTFTGSHSVNSFDYFQRLSGSVDEYRMQVYWVENTIKGIPPLKLREVIYANTCKAVADDIKQGLPLYGRPTRWWKTLLAYITNA